MRKRNALILTACLLLTGCGREAPSMEKAPPEAEIEQAHEVPETPVESGESEIPEEPFYADWREAYTAFLEGKAAEAAWLRDPENPDYDPNWVDAEVAEVTGNYVLYDIDKDSVPELLMCYGLSEAGEHTTFYSYADGVVTELGDIPSGHSSYYSWPGENAVARNWGHMGGHYVTKVSIADGTLKEETIFEETVTAEKTYTDMADIVPGSLQLQTVRSTVELPEFGALTLPVYHDGTERAAQPLDPARDEAAIAAIEKALDSGGEFYGVTADGFGGDTGWTTLEAYLQPGGVTEYAKQPLVVIDREWLDFNGDGQSEALVILQNGTGGDFQDTKQVVFSWQDGAVYAYCMNYMDAWYKREGTVFLPQYGGAAITLAFDGYQAYMYAPGQETL